jgi:4,5-dihydroxyphthalate decarboxylase
MTMAKSSTVLRTVLGTYPHTLPLMRGEVTSPKVAFDFVEIKPTNRAFRPMAMEQAFDICEMAVVTYLQARSVNKPLTLLPAVMFGRFQHGCMLYNAGRGLIGPLDLAGRKIAVRAYAQTTGVWLRGILANDYGTNFDRARWVTFEDAHVTECRDPPGVERTVSDKSLTTLLLEGEVDAAIYGADVPVDPRLKSVIPDPEVAAQGWYRKYGFSPINHMVVIKEAVARENPQIVKEVYQLLLASKRAANHGMANDIDTVPFGIAAVRPALERIIDYAAQQQVIARRLSVDELFDDVARRL